MREEHKNLAVGLILLTSLFFLGALVYSSIEGVSYSHSLFFVFMTITTVGSGIAIPESFSGLVFSIILVVSGMGIALYVFSQLSKIIIEGGVKNILKGGIERMKKKKNHFVVCGYGRVGRYVCDTFEKNNVDYVVIDKSSEKITTLNKKKITCVEGDALEPEVLKSAGIRKAKGLIATLDTDANNVFCIMAAKDLNEFLILGAEATNEESVDRLHEIGANIVVYPAVVGGEELANAALQKKSKKKSSISKEK